MKKKLLISVLSLGIAFVACTGCFDTTSSGDSTSMSTSSEDSQSGGSGNETTDKVFEGEMLLNGFESIEDLYKIRQHETTNNGGSAKFDIVGEEDFLFLDSQTKIDKANEAVAALPDASAITQPTNELRSLASKARALYSSLTALGKKQINGVDNMNAVIEKLGMKGLYTIGELKSNSCACRQDLSRGYASAGSWFGACADLIDVKEGKIAFTVEGISDNEGAMPNHALQLCLFHDSTAKTASTVAMDGIYMRVATDTDQIHFKLANGGSVTMPLMEKLYSDAIYTFTIGYKVADDYSKVTISVNIIDELDNVVCSSSVDISSFNAGNCGDQTVESWLTGQNKDQHRGLYVDTGTSSGVTVKGLWDGYAWEEEEGEVIYDEADLSPRQGEKALRVKYDNGQTWEYILARFSISELAGLPTEKLGGTSIKIYNNNPEAKEITFSLMCDYGNVVNLDDATFELAPYTWTTCSMFFDPSIIQYYAADIVGVNVYFNDRTDAIYYMDDWKVSFDQVNTPEQAEKAEIFNQIKADITTLHEKDITVADKDAVLALYDNYMSLSPLYKGMLSEYEEYIDKIYSRYVQALYESQSANKQFTLLPLDETTGLIRVENGLSLPGYVSYTDEMKSPNGDGSLKIDLQAPEVVTGINIATADAIYDELHIWVRNTSTSTVQVRFSNQVLYDFNGTAYDQYGNEVLGKYVSKYNEIVGTSVYDGWIRLVYRDYAMVKNIAMSTASGALYIGEIYGVSRLQEVISAISALDDYKTGYTDEQKAKVEEVRAMYDSLAYITKSRVTGKEKLFEIQAKIWLEDYQDLDIPLFVNNLAYDEDFDIAVDGLIDRYNGLEDSGKALIVKQYEKLQSVKERYATLAAKYNNGIVTLKDLNTVAFALSQWEKKGIALPESLNSTIMFKITQHSQEGSGIFYITLFYELQNGKNEGNGIGFTISSTDVTLDGEVYALSAAIQPEITYLFKVSYSVASDYSSMKVNFQIGIESSETIIANITKEYTEISGSTIEAWLAKHGDLVIQSGQCALRSVENAFNSFRVNKLQQVSELNNAVKNLEGKTLEELEALYAQYEELPMLYRMMVENVDAIQEAKDAILDELKGSVYTLTELGGYKGTIGAWGNQVLTMKNNMESTFIYKMTKIGYLGNQIHSFNLFYDGANASNGVRITFTINGGITINGMSYAMANVIPNVEYYYIISWKVADDYSKVTVRIRVEATGETEIEGTPILGDFTVDLISLGGADSIESWVNTNKKILIDAQQCDFAVANAWTAIDVEELRNVQALEASIDALTGEESLAELKELKATYEALPRVYQFMVEDYAKIWDAIDVKELSFRDNTYTLSELGGADGTIGMWGNQVLTMKDSMEGTLIYKMTKIGFTGDQIHSFNLFYDGANVGNGVRITFTINRGITVNGTPYGMANVIPNVEYYYLISWKVADDYSKVTVRIRVEATGETEIEGTPILGDFTVELDSLIGADSIESWVNANKKILIDAQQCDFAVAGAWTETNLEERFTAVQNFEQDIAELTGEESLEELNGLKAIYDAFPKVDQLMVDNYAALEAAIAKKESVSRIYNAYTLSELGGTDGTIGSWSNQVLTMKDSMEGTLIYKMTKIGFTGNQIHSFNLFYDGVDAGSGVRITFTINGGITINGMPYAMANVIPNVEYYYIISWEVADDYSKVTVRIRVEATGETEIEGTPILGDFTVDLATLGGADSIESCVKANNKILIDAQQCDFAVASAWTETEVEEKFATVQSVEQAIAALTGVESLEELNELKVMYDALPKVYQLMVNNYAILESAIAKQEAALRKDYTLSELGGTDGTIGMWGNQVLTMKDPMDGALIYKMTKIGFTGNQIHSFNLFYDGADAGSGVRITFTINGGITINGIPCAMANVIPNVEYYYLISWKVSDDYSKVTVRIRVEATGATAIEGTPILGDFTVDLTTLGGADSIESCVKANNKILIDAQQCDFAVASAWTEIDNEKAATVQSLETAISALTGNESLEELNALKATYDELSRVYQLMVDNYSALETAITAKM